jgi:hypothetical protein
MINNKSVFVSEISEINIISSCSQITQIFTEDSIISSA